MAETIEKKVAKAILQKPVSVKIGNQKYEIAPPSIATLILASEAISELPSIEVNRDNMFEEALAMAEGCRGVGDILAILILGAKGITEKREIVKKRFFGLIKEKKTETIDKKKELSKKILEDMTPQQVSELFNTLLSNTQIAFFLGITTSLIEVNLLKRTKIKTIVSGR